VDRHNLAELRRLAGAGVRLQLASGETLEATLEMFDRHGIGIDRGYGEQIVLRLEHWSKARRAWQVRESDTDTPRITEGIWA